MHTQLILAAEALYEKYLREMAPFQINAPAEKVQQVRTFLDSLDSKKLSMHELKRLFDPLVVEVLQMMKLNSFPKFQQSPFFHQMVKELHHADAEALREANLIELNPVIHPPPGTHTRKPSTSALVTSAPATPTKAPPTTTTPPPAIAIAGDPPTVIVEVPKVQAAVDPFKHAEDGNSFGSDDASFGSECDKGSEADAKDVDDATSKKDK
jgi:hypothetical protein